MRSAADIDLILMDIDLGSGMDGTVAAKVILALRNRLSAIVDDTGEVGSLRRAVLL
ncbi:MAG: hypothetical protein LC641_10585 [Spirochaeta sp.]|nr:hypothetical protein [Spirochaeta sp.]